MAGNEDRATTDRSAAQPAHEFRLLLLGPFGLYRNGVPIDANAWPRSTLVLLKVLATSPNWQSSRDQLMDLLWPDATPEAAASNLRTTLHLLRRGLGGDTPSPILFERGWVRLNRAYSWKVDLEQFEELLRTAGNDGERLEEALGLYRGEALVDERYDDWATPVRQRVRHLWRDACLRSARQLAEQGEGERAVQRLDWILEDDPLDEEVVREQLRLAGAMGRRTEALRRYASFEQRLRRELDLEPEPETQALVARLRVQAAPTSSSPPDGTQAPAAVDTANEAMDAQQPIPTVPVTERPRVPIRRPSRLALSGLAAIIVIAAVGTAIAHVVSPGVSASTPRIGRPVPGWGVAVTYAGPFLRPQGVAVDRQGDIYVSDTGNNRVEKMTSAGVLLASWGTHGHGHGQLSSPNGLALDAHGNLYVADQDNSRIEKFSAQGKLLANLRLPTGVDNPSQPEGVAVDPKGNIYVTDLTSNLVGRMRNDGKRLSLFGIRRAGFTSSNFTMSPALDVGPGGVYVGDLTTVDRLSFSGKLIDRIRYRITSHPSPTLATGIALDPSGNLYVMTNDGTLQRFTSSGTFLGSWGTAGSGPGQFAGAGQIAVDAQGRIYVADAGNNRVDVLSPRGSYETALGLPGSQPTQFLAPNGVSVGATGDVLVADTGHNRIEMLSPAGKLVAAWGRHGSKPGQFDAPHAVATDSQGRIYVADTLNNRIQVLSPRGIPIGAWGGLGAGPGRLSAPEGVALDRQGNVYVADAGNDRVEKFSPRGALLASWDMSARNSVAQSASGVAVDSQDNIVVVDTGADAVVRLSPGGRVLAKWGLSYGRSRGVLSSPAGVAVDADGNVFVADTGHNRVAIFTPAGKLLALYGSAGSAPGQFQGPTGIAIDANGDVYVADSGNNRIEKFSAT